MPPAALMSGFEAPLVSTTIASTQFSINTNLQKKLYKLCYFRSSHLQLVVARLKLRLEIDT